MVVIGGIGDATGSNKPATSQTANTTTAEPTAEPTAAPTAAPLPNLVVTMQAAWTVTDTDSVAITGSSAPGAAITGTLAGATVSATADGAGNFTLNISGLALGQNSVRIDAAHAGYRDGSIIVTVTRSISEAGYKKSAAAIPYNQLVKDPVSLAGRVVTYEAQVFQYDSATTTSHFIASVTDEGYGFWTDHIWTDVDASAAQNVCNNTVIQLWGDVVGPYTYMTTTNGSATIPEINIKYISVVSGGC